MNARVFAQTRPSTTSAPPTRSDLLQRKCACGGMPGPTGKCEECHKKPLKLQCKTRNSELGIRNDISIPSIVHEVLRSPGQSLDANTRAFMESRFGHDFSEVRVHTDTRAAESAAAVKARAYTVNGDIVFGAGEYAPQSEAGRRLLSHELGHVMQQQASIATGYGISQADDPYEREADLVARAATRGGSAAYAVEANRVARQRARTALPGLQCQGAAAQPQSGAAGTTAALPSADELTARIARCIGIWETNRGKDQPAPKESALDTVAGVHASMATIEQATMPYAISALKAHKELRDKASPPLTMKELNDAETRCKDVNTLLKSVSDASAAGNAPDDFIKAKASAITATGLSNDDVKRMFSALTLKSTLKSASATSKQKGKEAKEDAAKEKKTPKQQAGAARSAEAKALDEAIEAIPAADRLGLGKASLRAYATKPANWGEHRAGWQRKAVAAMPGDVGSRIEAVAVSDQGTALATPVIKTRVSAGLANKPVPSLEDIVTTVAQQNNPGEKDYGHHVWETYQRLYP